MWVNVYKHMYICTQISIYTYTYTCVCMYVYICIRVLCVCTHTHHSVEYTHLGFYSFPVVSPLPSSQWPLLPSPSLQPFLPFQPFASALPQQAFAHIPAWNTSAHTHTHTLTRLKHLRISHRSKPSACVNSFKCSKQP